MSGARPKASGYQRLSEKEQEVVNQSVENIVAADVVEPCSGQWSSPILLVPKKDGCCRLTQSQQVRGRRQLCYAGHSRTLGLTRRVRVVHVHRSELCVLAVASRRRIARLHCIHDEKHMVCYVGRHFQWASRIHQLTFNAPSKQRLVAYVSPIVLCTLTT